MKTKGISSSAYQMIDECLTCEINRQMEAVSSEKDFEKAVQAAELLGKLKAARSEFIQLHAA